MVRLLRIVALMFVVLLAINVIHPVGTANALAAAPIIRVVTLVDGDTITEHETTARTVGDFLNELKLTLYPADKVSHEARIRLPHWFILEISRAFNIELSVNGQVTTAVVARGTTAADVQAYLEKTMETTLQFGGDADKVLYEGDYLEFSTWRRRIEVVITKIPFETNYIINTNLPRGTETVLMEGSAGEIRVETEVVYKGDTEYSRELIGEFVIAPTPRLVESNPASTFVLGELTDTECPTFRYTRRLTMNASAYTAGFSCTGKRPGHPHYRITRSGREVEHGIVAVDPSVIPLGTKLYVDGYGFALAADTGSAIRGYKIDLFMEYIGDALRFGRRNITVWILDMD